MKKLLLTLALAATTLLGYAQEVVVMDKAMFIDKVFDYQNEKNGNTKATNPPSLTFMPTGAVHAAR